MLSTRLASKHRVCTRAGTSSLGQRRHNPLNKFSRIVTEDETQSGSQAMLIATGVKPSELSKPQIGIGSMWFDGNPCNMHLNDLATKVKEGVQEAGMLGMRFNTIGVSDGISMGTEGMRFSLPSRDIIADSIETIMSGQLYDAFIGIPGCDKNMPGCLIAAGRLNRPSIIVYGGTILPGIYKGKNIDIVSAYEANGKYLIGEISSQERKDIISCACPGAGACGGMYTANTMSSAIEALGMSLPFSSSTPATHPAKQAECLQAGKALKRLMELDIRPRDIMTKKAFENAIALIMVLGGSTNSVLHLIATAKSMNVELTLDDFQRISDSVPFLADLRPSGRYVMSDLHQVGGTPGVLKYLLGKGIIDGNVMTVTSKTLAENLEAVPHLDPNQDIVRPLENPIKQTGHIQILKGNLAPEGSVAKITGKEGKSFKGYARVFDGEEQLLASIPALKEEVKKLGKKFIIVIRYVGPKGGPGMPEMSIMGADLGKQVAMITDGRFSGGSHGFIIGHVTPEAQSGGTIALVNNNDEITIDAETREIMLHVTPEELQKRKLMWKAPPYKYQKGVLYKYIKSVKSASEGCVTDE